MRRVLRSGGLLALLALLQPGCGSSDGEGMEGVADGTPQALSEWGLFEDLPALEPRAGAVRRP